MLLLIVQIRYFPNNNDFDEDEDFHDNVIMIAMLM